MAAPPFRASRFLRPDALSLLLGIAAWEIYGRLEPDRITPFSKVLSTALRMLRNGEFNEIFSTAGLFGVAVVASLMLAVVTAALMSGSRAMSKLIHPYLYVFLSLPPLALVPVFMLLWGPTTAARIIAVMFYVYFPVSIIFAEAVRDAPLEVVEMAQAFGASRLQLFVRVRVPAVAVRLVAGAGIGAVRGLKGAVTTEVVMGGVGLGGLLRTFSAGFQLPEMYATILAIVALSLVVYVAVRVAERLIQRRVA